MAERDRLLFLVELKGFFSHTRCLHVPALAVAGVVLMAWVYPVASPFVPVVLVVFGGLELQFNNIFFRTEGELETFGLLPVSWRRVVLVKNIATIVLAFLLLLVSAMSLLYFSPAALTVEEGGSATLYVMTVLFPALIVGNVRSVRNPRRKSGFRLDDAVELFWMLASLALLSVPYFVASRLLGLPILCYLYVLAVMMYWYRYSVPRTGASIAREAYHINEHS